MTAVRNVIALAAALIAFLLWGKRQAERLPSIPRPPDDQPTIQYLTIDKAQLDPVGLFSCLLGVIFGQLVKFPQIGCPSVLQFTDNRV